MRDIDTLRKEHKRAMRDYPWRNSALTVVMQRLPALLDELETLRKKAPR